MSLAAVRMGRYRRRPYGAVARTIDQHLDEPRVPSGAADLGGGRLGVFRVHDDRPAPPGVMVQPARGGHLVHRPRERVGEVEILDG